MNRVQSQIRHDYKPLTSVNSRVSKLYWFAAGLGLPFMVIAITLVLRDTESPPRAVMAGTSGTVPTTAIPLELPTPRDLTAPPAPVVEEAAPDLPGDLLELTVRSGDTLDRLFRRNGLSIGDLAMLMRLPEGKKHLKILKPGDQLEIRHQEAAVLGLRREIDETRDLVLLRDQDGYRSVIQERPIDRSFKYAMGRIDSSLFEAGKEAGISDKLIMNLAGIFAWDIDFVLDIRSGDEFVVLYEELSQDGVKLRDGDILAAEFTNNGKTFRAVRFESGDGKTGYFTPEGRSMRKAFLRAPVDFSRISSNFNPKRLHPVLKVRRPHRGVDYAAPRGTPIKASGDGKVIFRGKKGGYGNSIILQHGGNITTLYAHMSRFAKSARVGRRVSQGQTIGFVGASGLATAPHLHYEYRLNGVHRNPRTVKLPQAEPVPAAERQDFLNQSGNLLSRLDLVKRTQVAALPQEET